MGVLILALLTAQSGLEPGDPLPEFSLPGADGKTWTQADFAASKVLAVVFTCNHCPTAQAYEDRLIRLHADYREKGVAVLAVSPNDDRAVRLDELGYTDLNDSLEDMKIRAKDKGFAFPYLYDGGTQAFSRKLGCLATPHVFVFDAERKLRYKGRIDDREVGEPTSHDARNAIEDLLAGREVKTPKTRAFGCSTKWAEKRDGVAKSDAEWAKREVKLEGADAAAVKALLANPGEKWLLVNVWSTTCGPCVVEFPEFVKMQRMYEKRPFRLVTISIDPAPAKDEVLRFLREKQAAGMTNLLYAGEDRDALAEALDKEWEGPIPYTLLVAPGGKIEYRKSGEIDPLVVRRMLADRLGRTYANRK